MTKIDQAKSIAAKLSNLARRNSVNYQNVATTFLIERLVARLMRDSQLTKSLVFKGGYVGLRVYSSNRYTVDLDALIIKSDIAATLERTTRATAIDLGDAVWFAFEGQVDLKTQGEYGGIRQVFRAGLGEPPMDIKRSQIINLDIGIGDPVTPGPVQTQTPELIGGSELSWHVYPIETIIAEKLQTLIDRGANNSRAKDVFDLHFYLPKANPEVLKEAIERCFIFRGTPLTNNPSQFLSKIDTALLKRGWQSAVSTLRDAPTFDEAFDKVLQTIDVVFGQKRDRK
jgi:predicted nucleotidyltransferase component of viral defense system